MSKKETYRKHTRQEEKINILGKINRCIHAGRQGCHKREIFREQIRNFGSVNV